MSNEQEPKLIMAEGANASWDEYINIHDMPDAVVVDVTNFCNCAECAHCYIKAVRYGDTKNDTGVFMDTATANVWAETLATHPKGRPEQIWIAGGEPTIHSNLGPILGYFKDRGFYTALITNGERFADNRYCQQITSLNVLDEVAVTIRGVGGLHDLLMLPADNPLWGLVPTDQPASGQITYVTGKIKERAHFEKSMEGLLNLSKTNVQVALNIDMQIATDMDVIVGEIVKRGGRVNIIYLQVQQMAGRAKEQPLSVPNKWREPTEEMVAKYLEQAKALLEQKIVQEITIIDPLPENIVEGLSLEKEEVYQPSVVPAISPAGELRKDVLFVD
ncbi:MAG TPA: radical SAM protein [Nevskiaceae bacterium]|nr:radical SAM protein [Nevskiaceae bacterium]